MFYAPATRICTVLAPRTRKKGLERGAMVRGMLRRAITLQRPARARVKGQLQQMHHAKGGFRCDISDSQAPFSMSAIPAKRRRSRSRRALFQVPHQCDQVRLRQVFQ